MVCNRDENCNTIARNYEKQIEDLNKKFNVLEADISIIESTLDEMEVPTYYHDKIDYLGNKVSQKITELIDEFNEDTRTISSIKKEVIGFATAKQKEHNDHYNEWLLKKKTNGDNNE